MRSTSFRPFLSNRQSSTFSAVLENSAKFVPRPSQVAPSGCGAPDEMRRSGLRNEIDGSKRWKGKVQLRAVGCHNGGYNACVAEVAASIVGGVGVEHLAPGAGGRHAGGGAGADL